MVEFYVPTFRNTLSGMVSVGPIFKDKTVQVDLMECLTLFCLNCLTRALDHVVTEIGKFHYTVSKK
jgi:hypothetical protein